uniref:Uncharacterized protein n=1 Tax=Panagrolaimus sp. ES5 TaxID=591445 RepID=A0AC34GAR5_9BILA
MYQKVCKENEILSGNLKKSEAEIVTLKAKIIEQEKVEEKYGKEKKKTGKVVIFSNTATPTSRATKMPPKMFVHKCSSPIFCEIKETLPSTKFLAIKKEEKNIEMAPATTIPFSYQNDPFKYELAKLREQMLEMKFNLQKAIKFSQKRKYDETTDSDAMMEMKNYGDHDLKRRKMEK